MITITYKNTDYTFSFEQANLSVHNANDDQAVLDAVGQVLKTDLNRGYQVVRNGETINITPFAVWG